MKYTKWALEQVASRTPGDHGLPPAISVQSLVDALIALRGEDDRQVFGVEPSKIEASGQQRLEGTIIEALLAWKQHFEQEQDQLTCYEIEKFAIHYDIEELQSGFRPSLMCDPMGDARNLSTEWQRRVEALREAVNGERALDVDAVHLIYDEDEGVGAIEFGEPDHNALYEFALEYECEHEQAFPQEIAAMWMVANGISFDDDPYYLRPISDWEWADEHLLCIGSGHYLQGSLLLDGEPTEWLRCKVVDMDDDGVVEVEYQNLGAFFDALLGLQ